jgi:hypothetical protein
MARSRVWDQAMASIGKAREGDAGRRPVTFHDLRRSCARILRRAKVDTATIMARVGHKTPAMFVRYAIVDEQDQRDATAAMEAAFGSSTCPQLLPRAACPLKGLSLKFPLTRWHRGDCDLLSA